MAQIEAYVFKKELFINNSLKNGQEVTENIEILAILPQKLSKNRVFAILRGNMEVKNISN